MQEKIKYLKSIDISTGVNKSVGKNQTKRKRWGSIFLNLVLMMQKQEKKIKISIIAGIKFSNKNSLEKRFL